MFELPHAQRGHTNTLRWSVHQTILRLWQLLLRSGVLVPLTFLGFMWIRAPHLDARDWSYDEGLNLMKALLLRRGYALYTEIWSDQPPLLTALLAGWAALFGETVVAARILMLLFSALLLWALYLAMRSAVSVTAAVVAIVLLVISEYFLRLAGAVMIGLPAMAVGTAAAALLVIGRPSRLRIGAAGLLFGAALQIKLIAALMGPAAVLYLLCGLHRRDLSRRPWRAGLMNYGVDVAVFGAAALMIFAGIALAFNAIDLNMLLGTHFGAETRAEVAFQILQRDFFINFAVQHGIYLIIAAIGVIDAVRRRRTAVAFPLIWFLTSVIVMAVHRPLWHHHAIHLTVPLAWLCAFGIELWVDLFNQLTRLTSGNRVRRRVALLSAAAVAFGLTLVSVPAPLEDRIDAQMEIYRPNYIPHIFERFSAHVAEEPGWVFTDHPYYAYKVGLPVPPPMAVVSLKRVESNNVTEEELLDTLLTYAPRYLILARFPHLYAGEEFQAVLEERYDHIVMIEPVHYYRLKGNVEAGVPPEIDSSGYQPDESH